MIAFYVNHWSNYNKFTKIVENKSLIILRENPKNNLKIGGEMDFKFKESHTPYLRYQISGDSALLNLLKNCEDKSKCEINFLVLLSTEKIQQSKGHLFDRLDSFLSVLEDYKSGVNDIFSHLPWE